MPTLLNPGVDAPGAGQLPTPRPNLSVSGYNPVDTSAAAAPGLAEANLGQAIDQMGDAAYTVLKAHQEKVDRIKGDAAVNQLLQAKLDMTAGPQGFLNQKGPQAVARPADQPTLLDEYSNKFTGQMSAIRSTLQNDDQKTYFDRHANVANLQLREGLAQHINQQTGQMAIDTYNVGVALAQHEASINWNNMDLVDQSMARIDNLAKNRAMVAGYNPQSQEGKDFIKALTIGDNTKIMQEVIQQAVTSKQFVYAQQFFDAHKDSMDAKTADFFEKNLADASQKQAFNSYTTQVEANRSNFEGLDKVRSLVVADPTMDEQRKNILIHQIDVHQDQVQRKNDIQTQRMTNVVTSGLAGLSKNADAGYAPTPEQMAPILAAAHGNPDLEAQVNAFWSRVQETTAFMKMSPADKQAFITQKESALKQQGTAMPEGLTWQDMRDKIRDVGERSGPNAVSPQGAAGRMQITRDTFDTYKKPGESFDNEADRVAAAERKIQSDFEFYNGDPVKVAAAYIGGRGAVNPDGTIKDVKDALGTSAKDYAARVAAAVGIKSTVRQAAADITQINRFKDIAEKEKEQMKADPVTLAQRNNWVDPSSTSLQPLDFTNPDKLDPKVLNARFGLVNAMNKQLGAPMLPLTQPEVSVVTSAMKGMNDQQLSGYIGALSKAWGANNAGYTAMMGQIAKDNPVIALAGQFAGKQAKPTDIGVTVGAGEAQSISESLIRGYRILRPVDGKGKSEWPMPNEAKMSTNFQGMAGDIFRGRPDAYNTAYQGYRAIYADLSAANGKPGDDGGNVDTSRADKAFRMVTGGTFSYNGHTQTLPWGKDESQVRDFIDRNIVNWAAIGAIPTGFTVQSLRNLPLKQVGDGKYVFQTSDYQVLSTKDKQPLVVDFNAPLFDFDMSSVGTPAQRKKYGVKEPTELPLGRPVTSADFAKVIP